jgi:hypothetical protein
MLNNVKQGLGYRDIIYNIKQNKFYTYEVGDQFAPLDIETGTPSGGTNDRPIEPEVGDLFWDTDLDQLVIWNGTEWEPVGSGGTVTVPSGASGDRPANPSEGDLFWDTTINSLLVYDGTSWAPATPDDVAVLEELVLKDKVTAAEVILSVRDGALVVTDPFKESVQEIDLGGTTPDPGNIRNVFIDGSGRYSVGASTLNNTNGLIALEYINSPGQFFVISDVDGGVFGPGDRQSFGLVRETLVDGTDLDGNVGPLTTGNSGGWSLTFSWYYVGGFPYAWTTYAVSSQTPGGSGMAATGVFGGQTTNRNWWELCGKAGVGKKMRWGIANGTLTDASGANYTNRLVAQMYVSQEMLDHPEASALLPSAVITNGVGWYTQSATGGEFENMGQFPNGKDKGYRFRWSTFGNTTLSQLPFVTGVSDNDQITSASGQTHYIVYNVNPIDKAAANAVLASGTIGPNNRLWPQGTTIDILQYEQPYTFPNGVSGSYFDLKYTYVGAVQASPLFVTYPISTIEEITEAGVSVAPLEKLHQNVCEEVRQAVTAYYLVRDFDSANTALINTKLFNAVQAALAGQLINTYDAVTNTTADDNNPEGTGGEVLFPQALKDAIIAKLELWMNMLPDN